MADAPRDTAPMEEETPLEEDEEEECEYPGFKNKHKYPATGDANSTMLAILSKMPDSKDKKIYASLKGGKSEKAEQLGKLLDKDTALKRRILAFRRTAVKKWNKERRAEEEAAEGIVDDGPLFYPEVGESIEVLEGGLREREDFAAEARERFGDLNAKALAQKLSKSNASEDKDLIKKLIAHRDARAKAYRESLSSAGGRTGRDGPLVSAAAQTNRAACVSWSDEPGKKAAATLKAVLKPLDYTSPPSDTATWDAVAKTVSTAASRDYTGKQCYWRASDAGLLKSAHPQFKVGDVHIHAPNVLTARDMSSLVAAVDRKHFTRAAFDELSFDELYERASDVYNLGISPLRLRRDREALIQLLLDANHCAVDPRTHGVPNFERANTPQFRRELGRQIRARSNVQRSFKANEARLGPVSAALPRTGSDAIVLTVAASRTRLGRQKVTAWSKTQFGLAPGEEPPCSEHPSVIRYFLEEIWTEPEPGVFDPKRQCACCHRLYIDTGGKVWIEHFHGDDEEGLAVARNNGGCLHCNVTGFELFDSLGPGTDYDLDLAGKHRVVDDICNEWDL